MSYEQTVDPRLGTVLHRTYRLDDVLGVGGMGSVYRARHVHLDTDVAVKVLSRQLLDNQEALKRFQREAQIGSVVGHPNLVRVLDFNFDSDGTPFMVMELLEGETLRGRLGRVGSVGLAAALAMLRQLCDGLQAAHDRGVVHRDLKPENIFLCHPGDVVKLLDFGISKVRDTRTQLTKPMAMLGTPYYMSPEQATGKAADADALVDVWAVGAIAFEMLSGRYAFSADNPVAVFYRIVHDPMPSLAVAGVAAPAAVDRVLARACAKHRQDRYPSTTDLWRDFAAAVQSGEEATRPHVLGAGTRSPPSALQAQETRLLAQIPDGDPDVTLPGPTAEEAPLPAPASPSRRSGSQAPLLDVPTAINRPPSDPSAPASRTPSGQHGAAGTGKGPSGQHGAVSTSKGPSGQHSAAGGRPSGNFAIELPATVIVRVTGAQPAHGAGPSALPDEPTRRGPDEPFPEGGTEPTAPARRSGEFRHEETTKRDLRSPPPGSNDQTAALPLPREEPLRRRDPPAMVDPGATRLQPILRLPTPQATGERPPPPASLRPSSHLRVAALGAATFLSIAVGTYALTSYQRQRHEAAARVQLDQAVSARRWEEAERRFGVLSAGRSDPALSALGEHIGRERRAEELLRKANAARAAGDLATALARLDRIEPTVTCAPEAARLRQAIVEAYQAEEQKALGDGRCADALAAAKQLEALLQRPLPDGVKQCGQPPPEPERLDAPRERPRAEAPLEAAASGMRARDAMTRLLAAAEPVAKRCFAKVPDFRSTMRLRVTAFPGSNHFVANAVSTGPIEIRACLESLLKDVRPPLVDAAVSAERVFGPADE